MTLVTLSADPSRDELRAARRLLKPLAKLGHAEASAELAAVDEVIRRRYPKEVTRTTRASRRRRRLIEAADRAYSCPYCRGKGGRDVRITAPPTAPDAPPEPKRFGLARSRPGSSFFVGPLFQRFDALPTSPEIASDAADERPVPEAESHAHRWTCRACGGDGVLYGAAEHETPTGLRFSGAADPDAPARPRRWRRTYFHRRGFLGRSFVGPRPRPLPGRPWCSMWGGQRGWGCGTVDLSAALEGAATRAARTHNERKPRNQRKFGSGRDKDMLTPGQETRSMMHRRIRALQARLNREAGRLPARKRRAELRLVKVLADMGVDVTTLVASLEASPPRATVDEATIAEARRRGDLPPDDAMSEARGDGVPNLARYRRNAEGEWVQVG